MKKEDLPNMKFTIVETERGNLLEYQNDFELINVSQMLCASVRPPFSLIGHTTFDIQRTHTHATLARARLCMYMYSHVFARIH